MIVVCDTSPLNYLVQIGLIDLLPRLFNRVCTPPAVLAELHHPRSPEPVRIWASSPPAWLDIRRPSRGDLIPGLGPGETEAITLAVEIGADALLIDERKGSNEATRRGLRVVGTLAVLIEAAVCDLTDFPSTIDRLRATNFRATDVLIAEAHRLVEERSGKASDSG